MGTIIVFMGIKNLPVITAKLMEHGRSPDTPVAVVRWASTPQQRTVEGTLADITRRVREAGIRPPALVVIGEVVRLRSTMDWFEKRPLFGRRIVVTRTREQASELVSLLEEQGAACLEFATIHIEPVDDYSILDEAVARLRDYAYIVFTSINGVRFFFRRLDELGLDSRALGGPKVAVVGKTTAEELGRYGVRADLLPREFTGDGLADALTASGVAGKKVLIVRAVRAREVLPERLRAAGADVVVAPVYRNVPCRAHRDDLLEALASGTVDMVTFTSSSTVHNFMEMLGADSPEERERLLAGVSLAAIGPITARTLARYGLPTHVQPETYTIPDLVAAITKHLGPA